MKTLTSLRISKLTASQLDALKASTGLGQSEIITTAIDRMYREEIKSQQDHGSYHRDDFNEPLEHHPEIYTKPSEY